MDAKVDSLGFRFSRLEERFDRFEKQGEDNKNYLADKIDLLLGRFMREEESRIIQKGHIDRNAEVLVDHEERIEKLEKVRT